MKHYFDHKCHMSGHFVRDVTGRQNVDVSIQMWRMDTRERFFEPSVLSEKEEVVNF
jgi:hypothetical protein